jgi:acetyltransferase
MPNEVSAGGTRAYPTEYVGQWTLKDGTLVTVRPIRPEDEPLVLNFYQKLSNRSVYLRYFRPKQANEGIAHEYLSRICHINYDREMVLVAVREIPESDHEQVIAGGRLIKLPARNEAECAAIVADEFQHQGLGTELLRRLLGIARTEKLQRVTCIILPENTRMRAICERLGFHLALDMEEHLIRGEITL